MNALEGLYFPGTDIYSGSQFPVFLLLAKTHLLQPVEAVESADNAADIFKTAGVCQAHSPSPLGDNRDRFLRLIRDIRERKDDYAAQLSALTVAALSEKKASVDDTQNGIIASLLGTHGVAAEPEADSDVQLWQARLVLKIAEILDQEEEEVAMQMALLDDEEEDLFKTLQGELAEEGETLFEELQQLREKTSRPTASAVKNRLSAWSRLYLAGEMVPFRFWFTHLEEAADILLERYEERVGLAPRILASFELPANIGWSRAEALSLIQSFRETNRELLEKITTALSDLDKASLEDLSRQWSDALNTGFSGEQHGRSSLVIYSLADTPCEQLIRGNGKESGTILGVVRWQK